MDGLADHKQSKLVSFIKKKREREKRVRKSRSMGHSKQFQVVGRRAAGVLVYQSISNQDHLVEKLLLLLHSLWNEDRKTQHSSYSLDPGGRFSSGCQKRYRYRALLKRKKSYLLLGHERESWYLFGKIFSEKIVFFSLHQVVSACSNEWLNSLICLDWLYSHR